MCAAKGCSAPSHAKGLCRKHYNASYYKANASTERERGRQWRAENAEHCRERDAIRYAQDGVERARRSRAGHPLAGVASSANYKARRLGVPGSIDPVGIAARFAYFGGRCWICNTPGADSIDHVKPLNKGGLNIHSNIRPAHLGCNAARSWEGRI